MVGAYGPFARVLTLAVAILLPPALMPEARAGEKSGLTYIVPVAAGSADTQENRPAMPDLLFADGSSMPQALHRYLGQVIVINFWASWCGPCIKEMLYLDRLQGDFRGQPLTVLAISEDQGGIAAAKQFLTRQKYTFLRPLADPGATMAQALAVKGLPTSIIVDRHGRQVMRVAGPYQWDSPQIVARLKMLMSEP